MVGSIGTTNGLVIGESGPGSAVSWAAILAGATAAASLSLILLVLGTGLGLAAASPWVGRGDVVEAISWTTILWIVVVALASSGLGGYIAGRLRVRWPTLHSDEVYFRDTAHGFLAWAVATLVTAALLTSAVGTILGGAAKAGLQAGMIAAETDSPLAYSMDSLFRASAAPAAGMEPALAQGKTEAARIFTNALAAGALGAEDSRYAGQLVAQRTGLPQPEAEQRVADAYAAADTRQRELAAKAKAAAEEARKNAAYASLWVFISLLGGAFIASLMATLGGRRRDLF